jgi:hypothetical protein
VQHKSSPPRPVGGSGLSIAFLTSLVLSLALVCPSLASAAPPPNLIGSYSENDICTSCGGSSFHYDWQITSEDLSTGSFSGTSIDGGSGTLTGTITGTSVNMTDARPDGYAWYPSGTLASDCSMSGTWTDNQGHSGTWEAQPQSGQCGPVGGDQRLTVGSLGGGLSASLFPGNQISTSLWFFSDFDPDAVPTDYDVTIDWGDGSTGLGVVEAVPGVRDDSTLHPLLDVRPEVPHTYNNPGAYTAIAHIRDRTGRNDSGGSVLDITAPVDVVVNGPPLPQQTKPGVNTTATIGLLGVAGCLAALIPEPALPAFAAGCGVSVFGAGAGYVIAANDPPDSRYAAIFLPSAVPVGLSRSAVCRHMLGRRCKAVFRAATGYATAAASVASIEEALAVSTDRYTSARATGNSVAMLAQQAAADVYLQRLVKAFSARRAAGRRLARQLPRAELRRITAGQLRNALRGLERAKGVPRWVTRRWHADGIAPGQKTLTALLHGLVRNGRRLGGVTTKRLLSAMPPVRAFEDAYQRLTAFNLAALIRTLAAQHALPGSRAANLESAARQLLAACTAPSRSAAVRSLLRVTAGVAGPGIALVVDAATPLALYRPGVSPPLPHC